MPHFTWRKIEHVDITVHDNLTDARMPCVLHLGGGRLALAFSALDESKRSYTFLCKAHVDGENICIDEEPQLILPPGTLGHFDEDGAMACSFAHHNGRFFLFYIGWQILRSGVFTTCIGRTLFNPETFTVEREFLGPVLSREPTNPLISGTCCVLHREGQWVMWYGSGISWERQGDQYLHHYTIRRAVSADSLRWQSDQDYSIPLRPSEYAVARPCVVELGGRLHMWFSHRGFTGNTTYRIGYADSVDGIHWNRHDEEKTLELSDEGWDSEMVCYPSVFRHDDRLFMLYNGNGYGRSGFGYAVAKL